MTTYARVNRFGATVLDGNRTRFRFRTPHRTPPTLEIEGREPLAMRPLGDDWFEVEVAECGDGARARYRYRFDESSPAVPDPASRAQVRAQEGGVHGWSVVVDPAAYAWSDTGWRGRPIEELVIYEAHVGALGGFVGVTEKLPALAELGVTAVELLPIADFPGSRNWGYDGVLPYAPASAYGSPSELKALIDTAHRLGLQVFLDVVYNHFGPEGNYLHLHAPDFFRRDLETPWGVAIDFRHAEVRRFFTDNVLMWLMEYRFDGLRFDAVHAIPERDWIDAMAREVRAMVEPDRHVHLILENAENDPGYLEREVDAQWNDDVHHCLHIMLTGEEDGYYAEFTEDTAAKLARGLMEGFVHQGEPSALTGGRPRGAPSGHLPPTAFINYLQNHDQVGNRAMGERLTVLAPRAALDAAAAVLLLAPQIPMLFMGEEVGATEPFLFFTDFGPELAAAVREGRRREFGAFPQFSDPRARKRIPDPNAPDTFARSRPTVVGGDGGDGRVLELHRHLLSLRHAEIVPRLRGTRGERAEALSPHCVMARWRMGDGTGLVIATNLGADPVAVPDPPDAAPLIVVGEPSNGATIPGFTTAVWLTGGGGAS